MNDKSTYEELEKKIIELEKQFDFYKTIADNSYDWEMFVNANGELTYISPSCEIICGYSANEFIGNPKLINEIIYPSDKEFVCKHFDKKLNQSENAISLEYRIISKSGDVKWIEHNCHKSFDKSKKFVGYRSSNRDISERKKEQDELKITKEKAEQNEMKFKNYFKYAPDGVFIADEKGNYLEVNPAATFITGYSENELCKMNLMELIPDNEKPIAIEHFKNVLKKGQFSDELHFQKKDKTIGFWIVNAVQLSETLFLGYAKEITERKKQEYEIFKAKEKAEESDRLKTAFLQNMSHEIRTPMNAIIGFSKMLDKPELSTEKRKSFTSIIVNSTNQLLSIITDILTISSIDTKQEKINTTKVCINNIIVDLLAIFKIQAFNQNISLYAKQQLTDKQAEIYTDNTKLTQILTNLITNALKFTHEGFIEFGYNLKNNEIEFYVKDSGIGIKIEMQEKIFERFRQADLSINKKYGGTGLGLAISKAFVELLGGKIWVQSELEKGSTFYFTILYKPVHEIDKFNLSKNQIENITSILIAEDEESNFLLIEELLLDMDFKLIHAKDGNEAVEICKTNLNINLILMDIKLPIMDGHTAAKLIKELKPDLPIVAQSAYAMEHERAKYEGIFDDYLTKPINEDDLKQMVMKYIVIQKT